MSGSMSLSDPNRRVPVDAQAVIGKILAALEAKQPQTKGELLASTGCLDVELNVGLDRAQTEEQLARRVIAGRIVFHLPDWEQPRPGHRHVEPQAPDAESVRAQVPPAAASQPTVQGSDAAVASAVNASALLVGYQRQVALALLAAAAPTSNAELIERTGLEARPLKFTLADLRKKGVATCTGHARTARWSITGLGIRLTPLNASNSPPAAKAAGVQPIETQIDGIAGGGVTSPPDVTATPSPREGLLIEEHAKPDLARFHADAAEAESARRSAAHRLEPGSFAELRTSQGAALPLQSEVLQVHSSTEIADARFALWSDGRLEVDAGDKNLVFGAAATRQLFDYLDRIAEIDTTSHR